MRHEKTKQIWLQSKIETMCVKAMLAGKSKHFEVYYYALQ